MLRLKQKGITMRSIRGTVLAGAALLLATAVSASAGGLFDRGGSTKDTGYMPAVATNPSWYARLDGAFAIHDDPVVVEEGRFDGFNTGYDSTWSIGTGIGRYFTHTIRGDLTYDYRFESDVSGAITNGGVGDGNRVFGLQSHLLLANLYYDFNRSGRINPYLGVGLGTAYHMTENASIPANCVCEATIRGNEDWHVAGAFMAGVSFNLAHNHMSSTKDGQVLTPRGRKFKFDIGYRYLYLGEVQTGVVTSPTVPNIASDISVEDLHAHEIRFGLRYDLR